jgi:hypothetical protein
MARGEEACASTFVGVDHVSRHVWRVRGVTLEWCMRWRKGGGCEGVLLRRRSQQRWFPFGLHCGARVKRGRIVERYYCVCIVGDRISMGNFRAYAGRC